MPQTVTVTGVDDDIDNDPDRQAVVSHAVAGGGYDGAQAVDVTVMDDDGAGVTVRPQAVSVSESGDGNTATYEVVLTSRPTGDVDGDADEFCCFGGGGFRGADLHGPGLGRASDCDGDGCR